MKTVWNELCRVATTSNVPMGGQWIPNVVVFDEVPLQSGDRVLVKDQTDATQNGIYVFGHSASIWELTPTPETSAGLQPDSVVPISEGNINGRTRWFLSNQSAVIPGTTKLTFSPRDQTFKRVPDLRHIGSGEPATVKVLGYYTNGDGGGGDFYWDTLSIDEDNGGTTIQVTGIAEGRWKRLLSTDGISVKYFGAKGDGNPGTDDTAAIQVAIDHALRNKLANVYMPDGIYQTNGPIHLGYGDTYRTVNLVGADRNTNGDLGFPGVVIVANFSNAPAIVVQGGRNVKIKNLTIRGASYRYGLLTWGPLIKKQSVSYQDVSDPKNWVTNIPASGLTRYAPYAGIAIDPYAGHRPAISYPNVNYPLWTWSVVTGAANNGAGLIRLAVGSTRIMYTGQSAQVAGVNGTTEANGVNWTITVIDATHVDLQGSTFVHAYTNGGHVSTQYKKSYSSNTMIENVSIDGFFVGVANQPCDDDANGDFTTIRSSTISNASYGVSVGNTQSRNVGVSNSQFQYVHTIFSTNIVGRQNGRINGPIVNCSASQIYQLFSFPGPITGPVVFDSFYVEEIIRLGEAGFGGSSSNPVIFNACIFAYVGFTSGEVTGVIYNVPFFEGSAPLTFNSTDVLFRSNFGLITGRAGTVLLKNAALQAWWYNLPTATDAHKLAYNYLLGGAAVLTDDRWLDGKACIVPSRGLPDPMPSLPTTNGFTSITSGRSQIHRYARYFQYASGRSGPLVPIQGVNGASPILDLEAGTMSPAFDASTLTLTFTQPGVRQITYNRMRIEPGCILWHEDSNAMFVVDTVTAAGTDWLVSAAMVTNYQINHLGQRAPVVPVKLKKNLYLYQTFHKSTTYQYRGDTTAGSPVINNVQRSDGGGGGVPLDFKIGDLVFNNDQFWDNHLPPGAHVVATSVDSITLDRNATVTAAGAAIELYR